jgi:hypothetical protein
MTQTVRMAYSRQHATLKDRDYSGANWLWSSPDDGVFPQLVGRGVGAYADQFL